MAHGKRISARADGYEDPFARAFWARRTSRCSLNSVESRVFMLPPLGIVNVQSV